MPLPKSILCSKCKKTYPEGWRRCPYCGHDAASGKREAQSRRFMEKKLQEFEQRTGVRRKDERRPGPGQRPARGQRPQRPSQPQQQQLRREGAAGGAAQPSKSRRRRRRGRGGAGRQQEGQSQQTATPQPPKPAPAERGAEPGGGGNNKRRRFRRRRRGGRGGGEGPPKTDV